MVNLNTEDENRGGWNHHHSRRHCSSRYYSNSNSCLQIWHETPFCRSIEQETQSNIAGCDQEDTSSIVVTNNEHCSSPLFLESEDEIEFDNELESTHSPKSIPSLSLSNLAIAGETSNSSGTGESTSEDASDDENIIRTVKHSLVVSTSRGVGYLPKKSAKRSIARRTSNFPHDKHTLNIGPMKINSDKKSSPLAQDRNVEPVSSQISSDNPISDHAVKLGSEPKRQWNWMRFFISMLKKSEGRENLVKVGYYGGNWIRWVIVTLTQHTKLSVVFQLFQQIAGKVSPNLLRMSSIATLFADRSFRKFTEALFEASHILRFGKWVSGLSDIQNAYLEWKSLGSSTLKDRLHGFVRFVITLFGVCAELFDDIEWLCEHQILPENLAASFGSKAAFLWMLTLFFDISTSLITLRSLWLKQRQDLSLENDSANTDLLREESVSFLQLMGDLVISSSLVSAHRGRDWNNGLIQGGGFLSGLMSLYQFAHK